MLVPSELLRRAAGVGCAVVLLGAAALADGDGVCRPDFIEIPFDVDVVSGFGESGDGGDSSDSSGNASTDTKPPASADSKPSIRIEADRIDADGEGAVTLRGDARVVHERRGLSTERIVYQRATGRAVAAGGVVFHTARGDRITAEAVELDLDTWAGEARMAGIAIARRPRQNAPENNLPENKSPENNRARAGQSSASTVTPPSPATDAAAPPPNERSSPSPSAATVEIRARATAELVQFAGDDSQHLKQVTLTACPPGNRDVELRARAIDLDHAAGVGRAKAMTLRFKGAPVFYFPAATFPIDEARKTGFLFPAAGYAGDSGAMLEAPYYLNLAPPYDATVTLRLWSRRGAQLAGKFRYLTARGRGQIDGDFLPSDDAYDGGGDGDRHAVTFRHAHRPGRHWRARLHWKGVSDADYTRDFSSDIEVVGASYLERAARLDYARRGPRHDLKFSAQFTAYEPVDRMVSRAARPYRRMPQLDLAWVASAPGRWRWLRAGVEAQYADFQHDHCADRGRDDGAASVPCGARLRVKPWLSVPLRRGFGYLEPRLSLQSIRYSLDERGPGMRASESVEAPIFSVDGGLYFDRAFTVGGAAFTQTLEPRLRYVNIPEKRAQRAFPDFDTAAGGGSFEHLFRENRFFGGDRIGDTEHVAAGVTSRIVDTGDRGGRQRLKLSLGQILYLQDRKIDIDADAAPATWDASGWFASADASLAGNWRGHLFARAHPRGSDRARKNTLAWFRATVDYRAPGNGAGDSGDRADRRNRRGHGHRRVTLAYTFNDATRPQTVPTVQTEQLSAAFAAPIGSRWQAQAGGAYSLETDEFHAATVGVAFDGCCWVVRAAASRYLDGDGAHKNRFKLTFELDGLGGINSAP
ncbi:MAG: LPS assembly protein LptD [Gammaproteobacteria bacterium]|nr:LPS assembly protein LptD [Gammaproteobacteria bacterium]